MWESSVELESFVVNHRQQNPKEAHTEHHNLYSQKTRDKVAFEMHKDRTEQESKVLN